MPYTFLIAFVFLLEAILDRKLPSVMFLLSGAVASIAASFYSDFMKDTKSSRISPNIRGGIIIMAVVYILSCLIFFEGEWFIRFMPNYSNAAASFCALFIWTGVISIKQLFNTRMRFETITKNYQGEQLKDELFNGTALLQYTDSNIKKIWLYYFNLLFIIAVLALVCSYFKIQLPFSLNLLLIILLVTGVSIYGLFEMIKWEHYYACEGLNLYSHDRLKRMFAIILITLPALTIAILLSSDNSLIPLSLVTGFFIWLYSLVNFAPIMRDINDFSHSDSDMNMAREILPIVENTTSPVLGMIYKYGLTILKYILIILAAAAFIKFMIAPLLNRGKTEKKLSFFHRIILIIFQWFKGMLESIVSFFHNLKNNKTKKLVKTKIDDIYITAQNILDAYSPERKHDIYQSAALFARLIIWGQTRGITWKPSHAPLEYCELLTNAPFINSAYLEDNELDTQDSEDSEPVMQSQEPDLLKSIIILCGEIFEKAIYSAEGLSSFEQCEFEKLIHEITS